MERFFFKGDLSNIDREIKAEILPLAGLYHFLVKIDSIEPSKPTRNSFEYYIQHRGKNAMLATM